MKRVNISRRAALVVGIAAVATLAIGGVAVAAGDAGRSVGRTATVASTESPTDGPAPADTPSPDDTPTPDDSPSSVEPTPDDSPSADPTAPGDNAMVGRDQAVSIALARVGGGTVTNVESEWEDGRAMWKVRIVKNGVRFDVYVDKATGQVMRLRQRSDGGGSGSGNSGSGSSGHGGSGSGRDHPED